MILQLFADGFEFAEGPLWVPGKGLLVSDTRTGIIWLINESGNKSVFLERAGGGNEGDPLLSDMTGPNGLALGDDNTIYLCQHGGHCVARLDEKKHITRLATHYDNRPFNSPNDLVLKKNAVFFTDPPYGLKDQKLMQGLFQPHAGVYKYEEGIVTLLDVSLDFPNGICFSNDSRYLFVSSNAPHEPRLLRFKVDKYNYLQSKTVFCPINADGITITPGGVLIACADDGLLFINPRGKIIDHLKMEKSPSNVCCHENYFYVTAREHVYWCKL